MPASILLYFQGDSGGPIFTLSNEGDKAVLLGVASIGILSPCDHHLSYIEKFEGLYIVQYIV